MALTPQEITFYAGDTRTVVIPLKNDSDASAFPPTGYNLIFTAKASNAASDNGAKFQYSTGAGITHGDGDPVALTSASVVFHPVDTRAHGGKTLYWDIQAEHLTNPDDVRTVAVGTLVLKRDTTRQTTTSVPLHTLSEAVPYTGPTGETPLVTSTTPPSDHDAIWFDPETGGFSVWYVDAWVAVGEGGAGGPPTAAEITAALQGAEADATKIGAEYMPEALTLDSLILGDTSADTLPVGAIGGTGTDGEISWHNNSDEGGVKYQMSRNVINGYVLATAAEIQAGIVHKELGRFRLEPSEIVAALSGHYELLGDVWVLSHTDSSLASAPVIGIHIASTSSTSAIRGVSRTLVAAASGYFNSLVRIFAPISIYDKSGSVANTYQIRVDDTLRPRNVAEYISSVIGVGEAAILATMSDSIAGTSHDALWTTPAEIILSLRVPQDATFTGEIIAIANNVTFKPLA